MSILPTFPSDKIILESLTLALEQKPALSDRVSRYVILWSMPQTCPALSAALMRYFFTAPFLLLNIEYMRVAIYIITTVARWSTCNCILVHPVHVRDGQQFLATQTPHRSAIFARITFGRRCPLFGCYTTSELSSIIINSIKSSAVLLRAATSLSSSQFDSVLIHTYSSLRQSSSSSS